MRAIDYSVARLAAWLRDFGAGRSSRVYQEDLKAVILAAADPEAKPGIEIQLAAVPSVMPIPSADDARKMTKPELLVEVVNLRSKLEQVHEALSQDQPHDVCCVAARRVLDGS